MKKLLLLTLTLPGVVTPMERFAQIAKQELQKNTLPSTLATGLALNSLQLEKKPEEKIILQCENGNLAISKNKLKKLDVLHTMINDCTNCSNEDLPIIEALSDDIVNLCSDKSLIPSDTESLIRLFLIADKYSASQKIMERLAQKIDPLIDHEKEFQLSELVIFHLPKSPERLQRLGGKKLLEHGVLNLANYEFESLKGIENIKRPFYQIYWIKCKNAIFGLLGKKDAIQLLPEEQLNVINLNNNCLEHVDFHALKKLFPNLKAVNIRDNCIKILDLNTVPNDFNIDMQDNPLQKIEKPCWFNVPCNSIISIPKGCVKGNDLANVKNSLRLGLLQDIRDNYKAIPAIGAHFFNQGIINIAKLALISSTINRLLGNENAADGSLLLIIGAPLFIFFELMPRPVQLLTIIGELQLLADKVGLWDIDNYLSTPYNETIIKEESDNK
ncbi:MAG: hypothetical protein AB7R69_01575 [Candidatus Babeliales bacterium]